MAEEYLYCKRCRRPAPPELDGPPEADAGPWDSAAWELADEGEAVICPGCLTAEDETAWDETFADMDPVEALPQLMKDFDAKRITADEFEDRLAVQGVMLEALEESGPDERTVEARRLYEQAVAKLPPESVGDVLAKVYRRLDRLPPEIRDEILDALDDRGSDA